MCFHLLLLMSLDARVSAVLPPATLQSWPLPGSGHIRFRSSEQRFDCSREVTGDSVWAGTMCLLQWLCEPENRPLFEGKSVLELGSGTGFIGLSLAQLGASRVVLTDLPQQLPLLRSNIALNEETSNIVSASALPWGEGPAGALGHFDLIIGCEVTYIDSLLEPLARTTAALLTDQSGMASVGAASPVGIFAAGRHRAFASVPDHAHTFVYDLLETRHGLHSRLVGSVERPAEVVGSCFYAGAQEAERDMPVSFFRVTSQRDEGYSGFGGASRAPDV